MMQRYVGLCAFCGCDFVATWLWTDVPKHPMCPTCDGRLIRGDAEITFDDNGKLLGYMVGGGVLFQKGVISIPVDDADTQFP